MNNKMEYNLIRHMNIKEAEKTLKALANHRRLSIIKYLKEKREATVGTIAEAIKLSFTATSKHLGILFAANLVEKEQRSLEMWYRLRKNLNKLAKHISNSYE